ncbi:hypothetical protein Dimus_030460 [Dionaea muscipula]
MGVSLDSEVFSSPDDAMKMLATMPTSSPAQSASGGAQVKVDADRQMLGLVGTDLGLPSLCSLVNRGGEPLVSTGDEGPVIICVAPLLAVDGGHGMEELVTPVLLPSTVSGGMDGAESILHPALGCLLSSHAPLIAVCQVNSGLVSEVDSNIFLSKGGPVSEEVVVTPAARAALRPHPTDGLR